MASNGTSKDIRRSMGFVEELWKASSDHKCMALSNWLTEMLSLPGSTTGSIIQIVPAAS